MGDFDDDAAKYQQMEAELNAEQGIAPEPQGPVGGDVQAYDSGQHGTPQPPQYQPEPEDDLPEVMADPVNHFAARMERLEQHTAESSARNGYWEGIRNAETNARNELGEDYDEACFHLEQDRIRELAQAFPDNSQQAQVLAHSYGLRSAAELRAAVLNRDRVMVADSAIRNGGDPAAAYFGLAIERGYKPSRVFTKSQQKKLSAAIEHAVDTGDDSNFERLWATYERASKTEEELARTRRRRR